MVIYVRYLLLLITLTLAPAQAKERPVLVIPGIMGSKLCDQTNKVIWGDRYSYTFERINRLRLPSNPSQRDKTIKSCGLIDAINIIPLFWESDQYNVLISKLKQIGYASNEIIIFDYDWRLSNFENALNLKSFIESRTSPDKKIDVIAHSMGGLIARIYIQKFNGNRFVNNFLLFGTPNLGSAKIFRRLRDGFDSWPDALSGGLLEIQRTILSFPSTYQLMPTYKECCGFSVNLDPVRAEYVDILDVAVWDRFSWLPPEYRVGDRRSSLENHLREAAQLKTLLRNPIFKHPEDSARVHYIANGFEETWSRVFFHPQSGKIVGATPHVGDGTVLLFSATNGVPSQVQISLKEHELVFSGKEAELITELVLSGRVFHAGQSFRQQIVDAKGEIFDVESAFVEMTPRTSMPQGSASFEWTLRGERIHEADLTNATVDLLSYDKIISNLSVTVHTNSNGTIGGKTAFVIPSEPGPYRVRVHLSGIEPLR